MSGNVNAVILVMLRGSVVSVTLILVWSSKSRALMDVENIPGLRMNL